MTQLFTERSAADISTGKGRILTYVPIEQVVADRFFIRPPQTEGKNAKVYEGLKKDIQARGIDEPILVRRARDDEGTLIPDLYYIIDGMQRDSIANALGFEQIPIAIDEMCITEADVARAQICTNLHRITNSPKEMADHCCKLAILAEEREGVRLTSNDIATILNKDPSWVSQTLKLRNVTEFVKECIDGDSIPITIGKIIARLPEEFMDHWTKDYLTQSQDDGIGDWRARIEAFILEANKAKREGRQLDPDAPKTIVQKLRKAQDVKDALKSTSAGVKVNDLDLNLQTLEWVLSIDQVTLDRAKEDDVLAKLRKKEEKALREVNKQDEKLASYKKLVEARELREAALAKAVQDG